MKYQGSQRSVNVCSHCRKNHLSLSANKMGITKCAECNYFHTRGIYTIEQYNIWLRS